MNKIKQGFTLIEILIVISIIGVLAVTLVPNIAGAPAKARDLSKKQAVMQADAAIQAYMVTTGKAPALAGCLDEEIDATLMKVIFDNKMPSATTAATEGDCIADGVIYPKFVKVGNDYRVMIQVESAASANADSAVAVTYAAGTTHFSSGEETPAAAAAADDAADDDDGGATAVPPLPVPLPMLALPRLDRALGSLRAGAYRPSLRLPAHCGRRRS